MLLLAIMGFLLMGRAEAGVFRVTSEEEYMREVSGAPHPAAMHARQHD